MLHKAPELKGHAVVSREEWLDARRKLLKAEKEVTRSRDALAVKRRELPWVKVDKTYVFEGPQGNITLSDIFDGRSQLFVYHFMFGPDWEAGCDGCSFLADHIDGPNQHLRHHDVTIVAVSRASIDKLSAFKKRMGWHFPWYSSLDSDFNFDFGVSYHREDLDAGPVMHNFTEQKLSFEEQPGMSVFYKDENGDIFHTYSGYERAGDELIGAHAFLDMTPKGRNEDEVMGWMRLHDEYGD